MALVDTRSFNLIPQQGGAAQGIARGLGTIGAFQQLGQQNIALEREQQVRQALGGATEFAPQTQQQQQLAAQTAGLGGALARAEQPQPIKTQEEKIEIARNIDPAVTNRILKDMGLDDASKRAEMSRFAADLETTPFSMRREKIEARSQKLRAEGRDPTQTDKLLDLDEATQNQGLLGVQLADLSTKERFGVKERLAARKAKGLEEEGPSEVQSSKILPGGVVQIVRKDGTIETKAPDEVAKDIVERAEERGVKLQQKRAQGRGLGKDAAKVAAAATKQVGNLRSNNATLKQVIDEVRGGAETGPLSDKLPSFRAESVRLETLRNKLGLDVVGAVTFGALSEGELNLALGTALPTRLDGPELIEWADAKIVAQEKMATYLEDQAIFLSKTGNTPADWLERQREKQETAPESGTTVQQVGRFQVRVK